MQMPPPVKLHPDLPIFALEEPARVLVYTPGHAAIVSMQDFAALKAAFGGREKSAERVRHLADEIEASARRALESWQNLRTAEFQPECLTVYLSNACNLRCGYCYAADSDGKRLVPLPVLAGSGKLDLLDERKILAAAELVAQCCTAKGRAFQLVMHGGGEPTLHWDLLRRTVQTTRDLASRHDLPWRGYIATHGVFDGDKAEWLARNFDKIGISCDGPPDIHDAQRPAAKGAGTSAAVARTIRRLIAAGADVAIRATITPRFVQRQSEIACYFHQEFGLREIRFEPVYLAQGRAMNAFAPGDAPRFASHFLAAQRIAAQLGCRLELSGVRLDEIHGPYCNVLRDVLHLTPDGSATACFLSTDGRAEPGASMIVGAADAASGRFVLDDAAIDRIRDRALRVPRRCHECVNVYHCARDCPDVCPVTETGEQKIETPGFRCGVQKIVGQAWIRQAASNDRTRPFAADPCRDNDCLHLSRLMAKLPDSIDADAIVRQWQSASKAFTIAGRTMPPPPWSGRGFEDNAERAWNAICSGIAARGEEHAVSAYVHMPFCDRKCAFCDCYALYMDPAQRQGEAQYVDALIRELAAWSRMPTLRNRPVTTIHFGGGTPNYTSPAQFSRLLAALKDTLHITPSTELALESTTTQICPEHLQQLREWGFRRLHVGVQTYHDDLRKLIGRRENAQTVRQKLEQAIDAGFIVSVDLVYGLPGQTLDDFSRDVETTIAAKVDGCSLYHLNSGARNRTFIATHAADNREPITDYLFFQVGEQLLRAGGYRKNHFAHFARPRDRNLYYTHVVRNEDLIALGASADGAIGGYVYRHPTLGAYVNATTSDRPALEGGLREAPWAMKARPASAALMAGEIDPSRLQQLNATGLFQRWLELDMLEPAESSGAFVLTANGSWFLSELLAELNELVQRDEAP
jgi:coproporphyrinogen III oxidase-like Fe-S oxidoreductase/sulfatase maturation enzyme AslB (radical SAM superfamily)